jgi:hypothetical protein
MATGRARYGAAFGLLALSALGCAIEGPEEPILSPASPVPVGRGAGALALVDVDRDGHLDIVSKYLLTRNVALHLGDGRGHFASAPASPVNLVYEPGAMAVADLNGDGAVDLVIASRDAAHEDIHVLPGDGRGGFPPNAASSYSVSAASQYYKPTVRILDVNGDARLDIVTANGRRNTVEILLGDGAGGFAAGRVVTLEPSLDFHAFAVGDVDGDGHVDLVTTSSALGAVEDRLLVRPGDGLGGFRDGGPSARVAAGSRAAVLAQLNGDHLFDLVLAHGESHLLSVLVNTGRGVFTPGVGSPHKTVGDVFAMVVADVSRDGHADVVTATVDSVSVLAGDGNGFTAATGSPFPAGPGTYNVAVGDINEDGRLDVAASSFEGDSIALLIGR